VAASDIDKMTGPPLLGSGGTFELIKETVGEIAPGEDYRRSLAQGSNRLKHGRVTTIHDCGDDSIGVE